MFGADVDYLIHELPDVATLEVVPPAGREAGIEHRLMLQKRFLDTHVGHGWAELPEGSDDLLAPLRVANPAADDHDDPLTVQLGRNERQRWRLTVNNDGHELVRRAGDPVAIEAKNLCRFLHRPEQRSCKHVGAQRHAAKLELGDDPEIATPAAHSPEQVSIVICARTDEVTRSRDQIDGEQIVDRESVLSHDPTDPATQGETPH